MGDTIFRDRKAAGITCIVHRSLRRQVMDFLEKIGITKIYVEVGKSERLFIKSRPFGLPGAHQTLHDSPVEIFRFSISTEDTSYVLNSLIAAAELDVQGRGMIFAQELHECGKDPLPHIPIEEKSEEIDAKYSLLPGLSLITCILSRPGGGEELARTALELGTCVPVITNGRGTGMRDNLGLLRITIPPEKEIVQLIVPEYDADNIIRLLIEEAKMNLPGRGFLFRTPIDMGVVDTRLRIGRQEHAASIEQIISAIDELKMGTHWRKRFSSTDKNSFGDIIHLLNNYQAISFVCREGKGDSLVNRAMEAGAPGATISRISCLNLRDRESDSAARERNVICVPNNLAKKVIDALLHEEKIIEQFLDFLWIQDVPSVFSYIR
jgi:nitrogen regulatory protein PII